MKIKVKTLEELRGTPNMEFIDGDMRVEETHFVVEMQKYCGKVIEVRILDEEDDASGIGYGYTVQMPIEMPHYERAFYFAPWMYDVYKPMNRNGANS